MLAGVTSHSGYVEYLRNCYVDCVPAPSGGAFAAGALLLGLVLLVPALEPVFAVVPLSAGRIGAAAGLAFGSMLTIQLLKLLRR